MIIQECGGRGNAKQVMKKVWIQMLGLPAELSDFLTIWAIGTILGVITRYVDMRFTWEYDRARLQVLLLDLVLIPNSINVVIEESVYELHFWIEPKERKDKPEPLDMDDKGDDNLVEIQQWIYSRTIVHPRSIFNLWKRNAEANNYLLEKTKQTRNPR
jgi:hypothetical protein